MTTETLALAEDQFSLPEQHRLRTLGLIARRNPLGVFGLVIAVVFVFLALFGPFVTPYDPMEPNVRAQLQGPSLAHPFGTDTLGQDILSRVIAGARISFIIGLAAVGIGVTGGSLMGVISGYFGGVVDSFIQRSGEAAAAFPGLFLYLMMIAALGRGEKTIVLAIALSSFIGGSRIMRVIALGLKGSAFVEASRSIGATDRRILFRHIIPNVMPFVILGYSGAWGAAVLGEAAISFLGLGVPPGTPSWGMDLSSNYQLAATLGYWHLVAFTGGAISLVVLGFNLMGDTLRDILDPRLRGQV
jgi:ABC-type dipeptide/oligopeptide/nickel transport system permease subunit